MVARELRVVVAFFAVDFLLLPFGRGGGASAGSDEGAGGEGGDNSDGVAVVAAVVVVVVVVIVAVAVMMMVVVALTELTMLVALPFRLQRSRFSRRGRTRNRAPPDVFFTSSLG